MEKEKKKAVETKALSIKETTTCDATAQMLRKAERDGVETAFHRAFTMKACPIGADSACCKHCSMGPCRLNPKDPYAKVGVCGATIDTIVEETKFHKLLFEGLEELGFGKWGFTVDPHEMARIMIAHIDEKRRTLRIDKARERVLVDMAARRELEAA